MPYIYNMSDAAYHADKAHIGSSILRKVTRESPAHALHSLLYPLPSTPDMRFGTAVHICALQPEVFASTYMEGPDGPLNRNPWKKELAELKEAFPCHEIIKPADMHRIEQCAQAVCAAVTQLLGSQNYISEATGVTSVHNVNVKTRPDVLEENHLIDVKTSKDVQRPWKAVSSLGYDFQAAMYSEVHRLITGSTPRFTFLSVEKYAPYGVVLYELPESWINRGIIEFYRAAETYRACQLTGEFPNYPSDIITLTDPEGYTL